MKDFLARIPEWLTALGDPDCEELLLQIFRLAGPAWIPAPLAHQLLQSVPRGAELEPSEPATILNVAERLGVDGGDR